MDFKFMKEYMDSLTSWIIPGNSISVCIDNKEVFNYQSGYACIEDKTPMTGDTLINMYSCTKPITATAIMQLYEKGVFLLDDPLYDYIPEFKDMYVKTPDGSTEKATRPITMRHLLTMTSGITYDNRKKLIEDAEKEKGAPLETIDVARCIAKAPLGANPGDKWIYGESLDVFAAVVEIMTGKKFRDYVKENICSPLGIKDLFFDNTNVRHRMAEQYIYSVNGEGDIVKLQSGATTKKGVVNVFGKHVKDLVMSREHDSGGAGITTSTNEYSLFASALANGGVGATGERILASSTIDLMRTNQLSENQLKTFIWPQLKGYGYGLGVRTLIDKAAAGSCGNLGEFGWSGAAGATLLVDPKHKLSAIYAHHMLNPQETFYMPRLRNILYTCINS